MLMKTMLLRLFLFCFILLWLFELSSSISSSSTISRDDFPEDFIFGAGTSAYQVEGAAAEDGRTPSIWDTFAHTEYGDLTADGYHKYKEDVKLMGDMGLDSYRFSISWSRLIPNGRGAINPKGLEYYNKFIDELLSHGIEPHVTLVHFDLPQILEDEYGGWLSPKIVDDFMAYADVCFREFGDRVPRWTTINEANIVAWGGYDEGIFPPARCSSPFGANCSRGDSVHEPYIAAHYCLLAHSSAASLYKRKYQAKQQGLIGLNILTFYFSPVSNSTKDISATKRAKDFYIGWFVEPLVHGDYPKTMRKLCGQKLPKFTQNQSEELMASFDFIGVNYYYVVYVEDRPNTKPVNQRDFDSDMFVLLRGTLPGKSMAEVDTSPLGLEYVLDYFKKDYGNPTIYLQENGYMMNQNSSLNDTLRVDYIKGHLQSLLAALRNGSNTKGYFAWSFMDVFELFGGYKSTFGLYFVDFNDKERKRYPKFSACWYSNFLNRRGDFIYSHNISSCASSFSAAAV